jgi:cellobiose epimerase
MLVPIALAVLTSFALLTDGAGAVEDQRRAEVLDGSTWKNLVLDDLIPLWYEHVRDEEHGAVYMNLTRDWQPQAPWDKLPAMISRQVFSFSAAYLLSGEEKYLAAAREGAEYLLDNAWDEEYGGWFDGLTQTGAPMDSTKSVPLQLYTNVGLTLYYFTTGDERVLDRVMKSVEIRRSIGHDDEFDGYYQVLDRQLRVLDDGKKKHAHFGYVGSLLLNLYLATRDDGVLQFESHLMDLTLERMTDPDKGWVYGAASVYDRQWQRTPWTRDGTEMVHVGGQLTTCLAYLRLYHQTGDERYRQAGENLASLTTDLAWDSERGGWLHPLPMEPDSTLSAAQAPEVSWWIQIYGSLMQLHLYRLTGDTQYLDRFAKSESFYLDHFIDPEFGGGFSTVSREGVMKGDGRKASPWNTSYHDVEHGLLNYLYLNLYVNDQPVVLHFRLDGGEGGKRHFVSLADDPTVEIASVQIDGQPWDDYDAKERSVSLPQGDDLRVEVTLKRGR